MGRLITNQKWYELAGTTTKPTQPTRCGVTWEMVGNSAYFSDGTILSLDGHLDLANVDDIFRDYMYCGGALNVSGINTNTLRSLIGTSPQLNVCTKIYVDNVLTKTDTRAITNSTYNLFGENINVSDGKTVQIIYMIFVSGTNWKTSQLYLRCDSKLFTWDTDQGNTEAYSNSETVSFKPTDVGSNLVIGSYTYTPKSCRVFESIDLTITVSGIASGCSTAAVGEWEE